MNNRKTKNTIPILITWDVDPDSWLPAEKRIEALDTALNLCDQYAIPATFFFTAKLAETYQDKFSLIQDQGHEVGCHGFTHGNEENYDRMPEEMQRDYITQATEKLCELTGRTLLTFRSPRVKTSAITLKLLVEYGYIADSSVCSQRIDFVSSNLVNFGWLTAPRHPYHPHQDDAFRKGDVPVWEVPISAIGLPFISSTMKVFGLKFTKILFRLLYAEAHRTGKPIVYLAHPTEFLGQGGIKPREVWRHFLHPKYLRPSFIRAHGLRLRNIFYRVEGEKLVEDTENLFAFMASFSNITFMTTNQYTEYYLKRGNQ